MCTVEFLDLKSTIHVLNKNRYLNEITEKMPKCQRRGLAGACKQTQTGNFLQVHLPWARRAAPSPQLVTCHHISNIPCPGAVGTPVVSWPWLAAKHLPSCLPCPKQDRRENRRKKSKKTHGSKYRQGNHLPSTVVS